ncbi:MAG: hypothetical protein AABZ57_06240 [Candidatus Margulisiibacteriota bacterium]
MPKWSHYPQSVLYDLKLYSRTKVFAPDTVTVLLEKPDLFGRFVLEKTKNFGFRPPAQQTPGWSKQGYLTSLNALFNLGERNSTIPFGFGPKSGVKKDTIYLATASGKRLPVLSILSKDVSPKSLNAYWSGYNNKNNLLWDFFRYNPVYFPFLNLDGIFIKHDGGLALQLSRGLIDSEDVYIRSMAIFCIFFGIKEMTMNYL